MPGRHTAKQKRQAKHIAESERKRGVDPKRAESIGWATVNKQKKMKKGPFDDYVSVRPPSISGGERRDSYHETVKVPDVLKPPRTQSQAPRTEGGFNPRTKAPETRSIADTRPADPRTVPGANTKFTPAGDIRPKQSTPVPAPKPPMVAQKSKKPSLKKDDGVGLPVGEAYAAMGKADPLEEQFREMTEKLRRRAQGGGKRAARRSQLAAFGKEKSMSKSLRVMSIGDYYDSVVKAEGGPSGGGGGPAAPGAGTGTPKKFPRKLKPTVKMKPISDQEAIANLRAGKFHEKSLVMLAAIKALVSGYGKVSGGGALRAPNRGFPTVEELLQRAMEVMPKPKGPVPPATVYLPGAHGPEVKERAAKIRAKTSKRQAAKADYASSMEEPTLKKQKNVVHKAEGDASMSKTNFNDLFKSELGVANDDVLVDCPHCEAPITKSDLAKAHKGKGATTNVSGPKTAGGNLRSQNPEGGTMRGGDGRGQVTSSRGVPGADKTDAVVGVQNSKGSRTHKAMDDSSSCADDVSSAGAASSRAKKSMGSVRGTEFVQYIDYGDAPGSDASIAKSIAEAQGQLGQQATQPMDLNNDLSRLLV